MSNISDKIGLLKKQKYASAFSVFFQAIIFILLGIIVINIDTAFLYILIYIVSGLFITLGMVSIVKAVFQKNVKLKISHIVQFVLYLGIGMFFIFNNSTFVYLFPLLFTGYIAIDSIIKTIECMIALDNKLKNAILQVLRTVLSYVFLVILLIFPLIRAKVTVLVGGIYFIILGSTFFLEAIDLVMTKKTKNRIKKRIRIPLPVFISAFIPMTAVKSFNKLMDVKEENKKIVLIKESQKPDMEILIHMKDKKNENMGHIDINMDGMVTSYGSYDENNVKLFSAIGDGVLFEVEKEKYIEFCTSKENKTIITYGIVLTKEQKQAIKDQLELIKKDIYRWDPLSKLEPEKEHKDYASRLYDNTGAKLFKFVKGKFKTYFVLSTNCVALPNELVGTAGIDILAINGLITPGTYYDYFSREFKRKNSAVITKEIYLNKTNK